MIRKQLTTVNNLFGFKIEMVIMNHDYCDEV